MASKGEVLPATYGPGERGKDHTALVFERTAQAVKAVTMYGGMPHRLMVVVINPPEFDRWFAPTPKTPCEKLAQILLAHGKVAGATPEALDLLRKFVKITDKEHQEMVAKNPATAETKAAPPPKPKAAEKAAATPKTPPAKAAEKPAAKAAPASKVTPPPKIAAPKADAKVAAPKADAKAAAPKAEKKVAAPAPAFKGKVPKPEKDQKVGAYTQQLIQLGMSNEQVVEALNASFADKSNSASNVNWYRNKLKKDGVYPK